MSEGKDNQIDSLTVGVGLDTSGFKRGQQEVNSGLGQIEKGAKDAAESVEHLGDKASETGDSLSSLGGTSEQAGKGVGGLGDHSGAASKKIAQLQKELARTRAEGKSTSDEIKKLQSEIARLQKGSGTFSKNVGANVEQMTRSFRGLANEVMGIMALGKTGSFLGNSFTSSINNQSQIGRSSQSMGLTPREREAWGSVFKRVGGTDDEAQSVIGGIRRAQFDAKYNGIAPIWTRASGFNISPTNEDGSVKDPAQILAEALRKLQGLPVPERAYWMQVLFGASPSLAAYAARSPEYLLSELNDAKSRSGVTDDGISGAERLQRSRAITNENVQGQINRGVGAASGPVGDIVDWANNHPVIETGLSVGKEVATYVAGWVFAKKVGNSILSKLTQASASAAKTAAGEAAASAGAGAEAIAGAEAAIAAERVGLMSKLVPWLKGGFIASVLYEGIKPTKTAGPESDMLIKPTHPRPEDPLEKLGWLEQLGISNNMDRLSKGQFVNLSEERRKYEESIWKQHLRAKKFDASSGMSEMTIEDLDQRPKPSSNPPKQSPALSKFFSSLGPVGYEGIQSAEQVAQRILFKESRGRRYDDAGRLTVSSKGARGEFQVMPSTAHDPSILKRLGVNPVKDDSPDEYARFARDLIAAYHRKYNGDSQKIMAAYNAGDGATDKAIAQWGDHWREHMPAETRGYMDFDPSQRNFGGYPAGGLAKTVYAMPNYISAMQVPQQLRDQVNPAYSPIAQQPMIQNDNRITNTTSIDAINVNMHGGNAADVATNIGSAVRSHPINGGKYA